MINSVDKMVPELRFKEFNKVWKEKKLGDIATFTKGKGISKADISEDGALECIRYGELYTHYGEVIKEIKSKTNLPKAKLILSEANDVIIPASGEARLDIATASCVLKGGIALSGDLNIIKAKLDGTFLAYYLNSKKKKTIASLAQGVSVVHLYSRQLKSLKLNVPTLPEQQKIADFLTTIETKIQQLTKKQELLKAYKKGMMQQIFSQEIRFKDEDGKEFSKVWKERKLGDIATFTKGKGISKADISEDGALECIRYGELYTHYGEVIKEVKSKTNLPKAKLILSEANDVIIPASGETRLDIATASCVLKGGVALSGDLNIIKAKLNGTFLAYYLNSKKKKAIASLAQGVSVVHLYSRQLKSLKLNVPTLPEQQKIANFLTALDDKITQIGKQLEGVQAYKKGLLQQIFI